MDNYGIAVNSISKLGFIFHGEYPYWGRKTHLMIEYWDGLWIHAAQHGIFLRPHWLDDGNLPLQASQWLI